MFKSRLTVLSENRINGGRATSPRYCYGDLTMKLETLCLFGLAALVGVAIALALSAFAVGGPL